MADAHFLATPRSSDHGKLRSASMRGPANSIRGKDPIDKGGAGRGHRFTDPRSRIATSLVSKSPTPKEHPEGEGDP